MSGNAGFGSSMKDRSVRKSQGEGADASYDGAVKSAFADSLKAKPSAGAMSAKPRFKETRVEGSEVDVKPRGIADASQGRAAVWESTKPRFKDPTPASNASYETATSAFQVKQGPSAMMRTPEKEKPRGAWMDRPEQVSSPAASYQESAFNSVLNKKSASPMARDTKPKIKPVEVVSYGDPGGNAPLKSDFNDPKLNRPSVASMASSQRFKAQYNVPSHGDPGAAP